MRRFLFLLLVAAMAAAFSGGNDTRYFYLHVNLFRSDPQRYAREFRQEIACGAVPTRVLFPASCLEEAAAYQADSVARASCPISHETCPQDCGRFGGCGYTERLRSFCPNATAAVEVLSQGPRRVRRILDLFFRSPGHCAHLSRPSADSIGADLTRVDRNVFVADLAFLNRTDLPPFITAWCDPEERWCAASTTLTNESALVVWSDDGQKKRAAAWFAPGFFRAENISGKATNVWFTAGSKTSPRYAIR
ncbi:hypothetical protein EBZ80_19295 [bacterium]|nr:hypothetical protein [bacterium]